jgi:putative transposase
LALHRTGQARPERFIESFNSRLRDECLNEHLFDSLAEARQIIEAWMLDYNHARPHSSLGTLTPNEFAELQGNGPPEQAQGSAARPLAPPPTGVKLQPGTLRMNVSKLGSTPDRTNPHRSIAGV